MELPQFFSRVESYRACGNTVVRFSFDEPQGDGAVPAHLSRLLSCTKEYVTEVLVPKATADLERAAATGKVHLFHPYAVFLRFPTKQTAYGCEVHLTYSLRIAEQKEQRREECLFFDGKRNIQRKHPPRVAKIKALFVRRKH